MALLLGRLFGWLSSLVRIGKRPVVVRARPLSGWPGVILVLDGSGFGASLDSNIVQVGGDTALVLRASINQLTVLVGEKAKSGPIRVAVNGVIATAPEPFKVLAYPNVRDTSKGGPPIYFHGPQPGTPALGKKDQPVLVLFAEGKTTTPVADRAAAIALEMVTFSEAERFWRDASYASATATHETSVKFTAGSWVPLSLERNAYVWDDTDIEAARADLLMKAKRWTHVDGNRILCAHQGGGLGIADISVMNAPQETSQIAPGWIAYHVVLSGNTAFVAAGTDGLVAINTAGALTEVSTTALGGNLRGCDVSGNTLVVSAMSGGLEVYDISNVAVPVRIQTVALGGNWATCVKVVGNRAFVGAGQLLQVYDITNPTAITRIGQIDCSAWVFGLDVLANTCAVATDGAGLALFDVSGAVPVAQGSVQNALRLFNVRLAGNFAYAACGSNGILIADVSNPSSPVFVVLSPTGPACYDITGPVTASHSFVSLGATGMALVNLATPGSPNLGVVNHLTSTPPLGGDWDLAALQTNISVASDSRGKVKGQSLWVHAIRGAQAIDPALNLNNFEGIIVVIQGGLGRGSSFTSGSLTFDGDTVAFSGEKGLIWLAGGSTWGRKAHEVGHWFGMPDLYSEWYSDGTVLLGTAAPWDMGGDHESGPLFSGHQADHMQLFDPANIARRTWSPSVAPQPETFDIVAHSVGEDTTGRINLLELKVSDSLSYFVEVRQKPPTLASWIFDANIPTPAGTNGCVLVTKVEEGVSISNTFERPTTLFAVLDVGQSVVDAIRLLRIEVDARVRPDPLVFRIIVHWNEIPPPDPEGHFDLRITPWSTQTWETPDIWINSPRNDQGARIVYDRHEPGDDSKPILNGDKPWVRHKNTIFAMVNNSGMEDVTDVIVTAYVTSPPGIGDNGSWATLETKTIPSILHNSSQRVEFDWTPAADKHTCISVAIFPQAGEISPDNNRAQENVASFDSAGSSSHEPVILEAEVRSPFTVWRCVELRVRGLPRGWHAAVDKQWVWVPPKGAVPVKAVIWTDLNSPRTKDCEIQSEALPRIEGWTDFGLHRYLPIGGILAAVRANAKTEIPISVARGDRGSISVTGRLKPPSPNVPGVIEITDAEGTARLVPVTSNADGAISAKIPACPGCYDVQIFSSSTRQAAEAESKIQTVTVRG